MLSKSVIGRSKSTTCLSVFCVRNHSTFSEDSNIANDVELHAVTSVLSSTCTWPAMAIRRENVFADAVLSRSMKKETINKKEIWLTEGSLNSLIKI